MKAIALAAAAATSTLLLSGASAQRTQFEAPVQLKADGKLIDVGDDVGYAGPKLVDWDGDGKQDLLVSTFRGSIRFFQNVGSANRPKFSEKAPLAAEGAPIKIRNW